MVILGVNGSDRLSQPFRLTRKRIAAVAACSSAVILAISSADAYRFFADGRRDRRQEVSEYAERWSVDVWGPGETLVFDVAPDPGFDVYFDSPGGVVPYLERALGAWAGIPTADISWRIDGVGEETPAYGDGRNTVFINRDAGFCGGHAGGPRDRSSQGEKILECDVAFTECWTEIPEDVEPGRHRGVPGAEARRFGLSDGPRVRALFWALATLGRSRLRVAHPLCRMHRGCTRGIRSWPMDGATKTREVFLRTT